MTYGIQKCEKCGHEMYGDLNAPIATHICTPPKPKPEIPQTEAVFDRTATHSTGEYTETPREIAASERQIDGTHYLKYGDMQPWDVWLPWNLNPFQAYALKYIVRYRDKGDPIVNIDKAIHTLQKLREIEIARK